MQDYLVFNITYSERSSDSYQNFVFEPATFFHQLKQHGQRNLRELSNIVIFSRSPRWTSLLQQYLQTPAAKLFLLFVEFKIIQITVGAFEECATK